MSDVPLGAFLSGGLDSTIVVGLMSRHDVGAGQDVQHRLRGRCRPTTRPPYARLAAERFKTDHTEFRVSPSAIDLIDTLIWHHDGPFGDSSAIPTYIVSKLTREHVTVALTGDGGDELFAGYLRFYAALLAERIPRAVGRRGARPAVARCRRRPTIATGCRARSGSPARWARRSTSG